MPVAHLSPTAATLMGALAMNAALAADWSPRAAATSAPGPDAGPVATRAPSPRDGRAQS
jgi:hypothetical protein